MVFILFYIKEIIVSNLRVAQDVLTPRHRMKPGVVAVPLEAGTDLEISIFANLITMTPGTLSLDVSDDKKTLYVHVMYIDDPEHMVKELKSEYEKKLLEVLR